MNKSGVLLIVIGSVLLAHNLGWISLQALTRWWPLLLIIAGVWSLLGRRTPKGEGRRDVSKSDTQA
ncbi:LiaI-LiaF-like domain-containing protein [Caldimonas brevitalea]|uniref:LiaI-LiaF-like transmembrane region domain-containing protein n=1 Tax=Caldimonas brevitalea TaxID=413882 RepID=A0A0G3BPG8_9BURK|nr:DUF5668 domain-containing protein [Caldimonas brevitalea]AKJ31297.1 hypothetical protein AAW51_4606 [Caldimonas brevitalea]